MKRKIHIELLATAVFSILLTLLCVLFVFYGVYQKQVIGDLKADALVMKICISLTVSRICTRMPMI